MMVTHRCPLCRTAVVATFPAADVWHACPSRPAGQRGLTKFEVVEQEPAR